MPVNNPLFENKIKQLWNISKSKEKHANQVEHPNAGEQPPSRKQKKQLWNISKSKEKHANQLEHPNAGEQPPLRKQKKNSS